MLQRWLQDTLGAVVTPDAQSRISTPLNQFLQKLIYRHKGLPYYPADEQDVPYVPPALDLEVHRWFNQTFVPMVHHLREPVIRKANWPAGFKWAAAVTHDVDIVRKQTLGTLWRVAPAKILNYILSGTDLADPYWVFPDLIPVYRQHHIRTTTFFLTRAREKWRYRYAIRHPIFKTAISEWMQAGHEVGLHTSLNAFANTTQIQKEKRILEAVTGNPVKGMRQHYLRVHFPEDWQVIRTHGFQYDSSLGFNTTLGFRGGTCFPFAPDPEDTQLVEIPFSVMDYPWMTVDNPPQFPTFTRLLGDIQQLQGLLNIVIHPHHIAEPAFRPYWEYLMYQLTSDSIWIAPLQEIAAWWQQRLNTRLSLQRLDIHQYRLTVDSSGSLKKLALEVHVPHGVTLSTNGASLRKINSNSWYLEFSNCSEHHTQLILEVVQS